MADYAKMAQALTDSLKLRVAPVAVSFTDAPPKDVPAHQGSVAAGCMFWEEGAQKAFATTPKDHENCAVGMFTHHMPMTTKTQEANLNDSLKVFGELGYVRPADIPLIPVLKQEGKSVTYAPLAKAPVTPDTVLLFVNFAQGLIVSEAAQQVENSVAPALGRPACAVIPQAVNSGRAALSLGCCGARAYLNVMTDDIALWALPGTQLEAYVDRISALSRANTTLNKFHAMRKKDVAAGQSPTIQESLTKFMS
jgi:uncharacterized protein (DUF169 family)